MGQPKLISNLYVDKGLKTLSESGEIIVKHQIKVGDPVKIYGFALSKSHGEDSFALFDAEPGLVKSISGLMIEVATKNTDIGVVEVHLFQVVPLNRDVYF